MTATCELCGDPFEPQRPTGRFCSDRCRQRAHRAAQTPPEGPSGPGPVELATTAEVAALGQSATVRGTTAVALARALDRAKVGHAGIANQLLHVMGEVRFAHSRGSR